MEEKQSEQTQDSDIKPPEYPESSKQKIIPKWIVASTLILVVILVISFIIYFLKKSNVTLTGSSTVPTPTLKPAMDWKTYVNARYNYSIEYPSNWSFREFPDKKNGAAFNPIDKPGYPDNSDSISISVDPNGNFNGDPLDDYIRKAGAGIQDYGELASIKKVETIDGVIGYETTWMVQPFLGRGSSSSESLPITYFELSNDKSLSARVSLNRKEDLNIYEKMLRTIKLVITKNITLTPTVDEEAILKTIIKKYINTKHGGSEDSLTISVSRIEGNYAQGGASDEGGGGMWFAAKEDGVWKLVWDGNGVIECSTFALYPNFPTSMIPECYDTAKQDIVQR